MATLGEITAKVSRRLIDASNTAVDVADVQEAINEAIIFWKVRKFVFNEITDTATLTVGNPELPIPAASFLLTSLDSDGFYIEYANARYPLKKVTKAEYDAMFVSNAYARPRCYAYISGVYQCYPVPDQAYTLGRHYLKQYNRLLTDDEENDFTVKAERLITLHALMILHAELRQDMNMAEYYETAAKSQYDNMALRSNMANAAGELVTDSLI